MLQLKQMMASRGLLQAELARQLSIGASTLGRLINHGQWPDTNPDALRQRLEVWLDNQGISPAEALKEVEPACPPAPEQPAKGEKERETMLLPKQVLTPATKKQFGLLADPFDELRGPDDLYVSPNIRYIREAMLQVAKHDGFMAVVGESGAGKTTLRRDLNCRLASENAPVIVIEPYVLGMEDNDSKGKTLKSAHIAEAIMAAVAPLEKPRRSPEGRFAQLHRTLKDSSRSGIRHVLVIEEAHSLPIPTLKHLKRLRELEDGFTKLVSIILIGQPELAQKLSPRNVEVREVVQRIEVAELCPIPVAELEQYLAFRLGRFGKPLDDIITADGIQAVIEKLGHAGRDRSSLLYPLAIGNLMVAALNMATLVGELKINADVIRSL